MGELRGPQTVQATVPKLLLLFVPLSKIILITLTFLLLGCCFQWGKNVETAGYDDFCVPPSCIFASLVYIFLIWLGDHMFFCLPRALMGWSFRQHIRKKKGYHPLDHTVTDFAVACICSCAMINQEAKELGASPVCCG